MISVQIRKTGHEQPRVHALERIIPSLYRLLPVLKVLIHTRATRNAARRLQKKKLMVGTLRFRHPQFFASADPRRSNLGASNQLTLDTIMM